MPRARYHHCQNYAKEQTKPKERKRLMPQTTKALKLARKLEETLQGGQEEDAHQLLREAATELRRLHVLLNTPSIEDFLESVRLEAAHQVERWGPEQDAQKTTDDWIRLIDMLLQKLWDARAAGNRDKALHHTISTSAVLYHWHKAIKKELVG